MPSGNNGIIAAYEDRMKKLLLSALISVVPIISVWAADYDVHLEEGKSGQCFSKAKRVSPAKYCHNCRRAGGDRVIWKFRVYCEGRKTEKVLDVPLPCKKSIPREGEQLRKLYSLAKESMEEKLHYFYDWRDCDIGDWPE